MLNTNLACAAGGMWRDVRLLPNPTPSACFFMKQCPLFPNKYVLVHCPFKQAYKEIKKAGMSMLLRWGVTVTKVQKSHRNLKKGHFQELQAWAAGGLVRELNCQDCRVFIPQSWLLPLSPPTAQNWLPLSHPGGTLVEYLGM